MNSRIALNNRVLDISSPVVMAIVNMTPDSFWEGSRLAGTDRIGETVRRAIGEGASILDVGGYSSRPGAADVSPEEEFSRLAAGLETIKKIAPDAVISVDTFRGDVARRCFENFGPLIINDISAGTLDEEMIPTAADLGVPYIAMHMKADPATMQDHTNYDDIVSEVRNFFIAKIQEITKAGVRAESIIIDPGFGFAKTTEQNYVLLGHLDALTELGYPVLSGISRKSMIYKVLENGPAESLNGTSALNWLSLEKGARILRVHDVKQAMEVVKLFNYYRKANGC